jgi:uncharacterized protein (DUF488 family)
MVIFTIGHSVQPQALLIDALLANGVEVLCDVRRYPQSRRNPQFNRRALETGLAAAGIEYRHFEDLGGRRDPDPDSPNLALRDPGFRAYADYMGTEAFATALSELVQLADVKRVAIMCAESLPWKCHRSMIADALVARGIEVEHIVGSSLRRHTLSPVARTEGGFVSYPALL